MIWGINIKQYLKENNICKFYGDKQCPCVNDKATKKNYDKKNGFWANGKPLPECNNCKNFEQINISNKISPSFTLVEKEIYVARSRIDSLENKKSKIEEKNKRNTPVSVQLLSTNGGTASEKVSKMIIGGKLFGDVGVFLGLIGKNSSNVNLIFKVTYADGTTKIIVKKANSKDALELLKMT